eukprot:2630173-Prymnesium_polylepis.1
MKPLRSPSGGRAEVKIKNRFLGMMARLRARGARIRSVRARHKQTSLKISALAPRYDVRALAPIGGSCRGER